MALTVTEAGTAATIRMAGFVATLRSNGFVIGIRENEDAVALATVTGIMDEQPLRWGWRSLLCARADDWARFDDLFDSYWMPPNRKALVESRAGGAGQVAFSDEAGSQAGRAGPVLQRDEAEDDTGLPGDDTARDGASAARSIADADFRSLNDKLQTYAIETAIRSFASRIKRLRTRREQSRARGSRIDLRRTLRLSVASGGSPNDLRFRVPRRVRPRLVLLLDVSRSMSLVSFFYLRVARALALELGDVHVFLYHTQLTHVSDALRDPDPWRAQERLQLLSAGWAGGTRIGECLAAFNRQHGRLVNSRTVVIIASDGYDTGPAGVLGAEMAALSRRAHRIAWFNPAKADPRYEPLARGIREALPHVDLFAAANSLKTLEAALGSLLEVL
ncbi:vWA domain-containing protein [Acidisoma cladoniae]|jgi:uncharacterized protein with von Willebrand factor type A (vWA) domain|uniref:vWA domain-containing protein n=1 Tax=Acidisoma cladoniae TaxID=3040935 RepID=UPI0025505702|nr:VWA domain-containing protein [Acidisoma sp. PAMC 29798]